MSGETLFEGLRTRYPKRKCQLLPSIESKNGTRPSRIRGKTDLRANLRRPPPSTSGQFIQTPRERRQLDVETVSRFNGTPQIIDNGVPPNDRQSEAEKHSAIGHMDWQLVARIEGKRVGCGGVHEYLVRWLQASLENSWVAAVNCDCPQLIKDFHTLVENELGIVYIDYAQVPRVSPLLHKKWSQRAYLRGHRRVFELQRRGYKRVRPDKILNGNGSIVARPHLPRAWRSLSLPDLSPVCSTLGVNTCECATCLHVEQLSKPIVLDSITPDTINAVDKGRFNIPLFNPRPSKRPPLSSLFQPGYSAITMRGKTAPPSMPDQRSFKHHSFRSQPVNQYLIPSSSNFEIRLDMRSNRSRESQQPKFNQVAREQLAPRLPGGRLLQQEEEAQNRPQHCARRQSSQSSPLRSDYERNLSKPTRRPLPPVSPDHIYSPNPTHSFWYSPLTSPNNISQHLPRIASPKPAPNLPQIAARIETEDQAIIKERREDQFDSSSRSSTSSPIVQSNNNSSTVFEQPKDPHTTSRDRPSSLMTPPVSSPILRARKSSTPPRDHSSDNEHIAAHVILPPKWRDRLIKHGKGAMIPRYEAAGARSGTPAPEGFESGRASANNSALAAARAAQRGIRAANEANRPTVRTPERRKKKLAVRSLSKVQVKGVDTQRLEQDHPHNDIEDVEMRDVHASSNSAKPLRSPPAPTMAQSMAQLGGVIGKNGVFVPLTPIEQRQVLLGQRARAIRTGRADRDELVGLLAKHGEAV